MACTGFNSESYDLYALGAHGDDDAAIQDHLRTACKTCEQKLHESLARATRLAFAVPSLAPPNRLRSRIVASVRPARTGYRAWLFSPSSGWAAAAVCALAGVSGTWYLASETKPAIPPTVVSHVNPPAVWAQNPKAVTVSDQPPSESALAALRQELSLARSESSGLRQAAAEQRTQAAHVQAQLEAQLQAKQTELASAQEQRGALESQLKVAQVSTSAANDGTQVQQMQRQLVAYQQRLDALTKQVRFYQTAIQSQRSDIDRSTQLISLLGAPSLRVLDLRATEHGADSFGRALLAGNNPVVFYASKLPALPAGRTYQLWVMRDKGRSVTSGGIFKPDSNQSAMLTVSSASSDSGITAFAVTEEPAGGQPLPTGHKILIGTLKA